MAHRAEPSWRVDDAAEFQKLRSHFLWHGTLLSPRDWACHGGHRNSEKKDLKDTIAGDPCFHSTRPIMADFVSNLYRFILDSSFCH